VHGGIYLHLARHRKSFVNFGNGFEFAEVDEDFGTEATGIRNHVNVPMEKVVRDNSDHLFPSYNTHIPDATSPRARARPLERSDDPLGGDDGAFAQAAGRETATSSGASITPGFGERLG